MNHTATAQESAPNEPEPHLPMLDIPFQHIARANAELFPDGPGNRCLPFAGNGRFGHFDRLLTLS
jgi:hypothetical protein